MDSKLGSKLPKELADYFALVEDRPSAFAANEDLRIVLHAEDILRFEEESGCKIGVLYRSEYSILVVDLVESGGRRFAYERLLPATESSAVVLATAFNGKFILLDQFRHSIRAFQLAFPRGFGEPGLDAKANARKELLEEVGTEPISLRALGEVTGDSGTSGSFATVFLAEVGEPQLQSGHEGIRGIVLMTPDELSEAIANGRITDSYTLAAVALLAGNLP